MRSASGRDNRRLKPQVLSHHPDADRILRPAGRTAAFASEEHRGDGASRTGH